MGWEAIVVLQLRPSALLHALSPSALLRRARASSPPALPPASTPASPTASLRACDPAATEAAPHADAAVADADADAAGVADAATSGAGTPDLTEPAPASAAVKQEVSVGGAGGVGGVGGCCGDGVTRAGVAAACLRCTTLLTGLVLLVAWRRLRNGGSLANLEPNLATLTS